MILGGTILLLLALAVSLLGTWLARRYARRLGLIDAPGERKVHEVATPRNGGIGIFWGFTMPLVVTLAAVWVVPGNWMPAQAAEFIRVHGDGIRAHAPLLGLLLAATLLIHLLGLVDDRRALAALPKLLAQLVVAAALVGAGEMSAPGAFRIVTFLDVHSGGFWLSAAVSVLWIVALTNAFNFLDNMDGLSAGVAFIGAGMFLIAALLNEHPQWFIAALLLTFMGSVLGFLCFNFPPASIFMGDGGSMVLGFVLSVLTIRTTYYEPGRHWYAVLMPLCVMAVPLYDLTIVMAVRVLKRRSPMRGDTNHFSHRLTRQGFTKRGAVLVIYGLTLSTGLAAPLLTRADDLSALLIAGQLAGILVVIGVLERVGEHTK